MNTESGGWGKGILTGGKPRERRRDVAARRHRREKGKVYRRSRRKRRSEIQNIQNRESGIWNLKSGSESSTTNERMNSERHSRNQFSENQRLGIFLELHESRTRRRDEGEREVGHRKSTRMEGGSGFDHGVTEFTESGGWGKEILTGGKPRERRRDSITEAPKAGTDGSHREVLGR